MYMGHDPDQYIFASMSKWWFYDEFDDSKGPYVTYAVALKSWKQYVREISGPLTLWDRLIIWWNDGKQIQRTP